MFPLVSITLFLPLVGALLLVLMRGSPPRPAHNRGLLGAGLNQPRALRIWGPGTAGAGV